MPSLPSSPTQVSSRKIQSGSLPQRSWRPAGGGVDCVPRSNHRGLKRPPQTVSFEVGTTPNGTPSAVRCWPGSVESSWAWSCTVAAGSHSRRATHDWPVNCSSSTLWWKKGFPAERISWSPIASWCCGCEKWKHDADNVTCWQAMPAGTRFTTANSPITWWAPEASENGSGKPTNVTLNCCG